MRLVMQELTSAFRANAIILTIQEDDPGHGDDRAGNEILRTSGDMLTERVLRELHDDGALLYDEPPSEGHCWNRITVDGVVIDIMVLPVKRTPGHRRMVLCALFRDADDHTLAAAEQVYLTRRPFAVGYFRLWQIDRTRQRRERALETALHSLGVGFILIDAEANTIFANSAARDILGAGDGLRLSGERIYAANLADTVRLRTVLDHISTPGVRAASMLTISRNAAPPLTLLAVPIGLQEPEIGSVVAVLYIIDPTANIGTILEPLCQLYQLTTSERKLACLLATGANLAESAEKLGIKPETARSVLKQIFRKTDTARQAELLTLMFSSIVRVNPSVRIEGV